MKTFDKPSNRRATEYVQSRRLEGAKAQREWLEVNKPSKTVQEIIRLNFKPDEKNNLELKNFVWKHLTERASFKLRPKATLLDYAAEAANDRAAEALQHLQQLALKNDAVAVEALGAIALEVTATLAQLTEQGIHLIKPYAEKQRHWPILKSIHPHFDTDHKYILLRLEVGGRNPLNIYKGKWNCKDGVGKIALQTWDQIERLRVRPMFGSEHWSELELKAHYLPDFDPDHWREWFTIAKTFILKTYKTPEKIRHLNELVKAPTRKITSIKIKSESRISSHFFTMLNDKFRSMAGCNRE